MLFDFKEVKGLIAFNTMRIKQILLGRRNEFFSKLSRPVQYQDRFRAYSVLASKHMLDPQDATRRLDVEFPEQQETTLRTMNSLFPPIQ